VPLRPGSVYLIPAGTEHELVHAGEADFVNFCLWWEEASNG
jgi:mannose-6-phosphate isomerase-like protein (cupin superfamily)